MVFSKSCPHCGERTFQPRTRLDYAGLREKLRSEHGPAVDSVAETNRALSEVDKDLEDYEDELQRLQSRIMHLKVQRESLQDYEKRLRSLICPIRRLPNEILTPIFESACESNKLTSDSLADMPALVLSGVCSRWRQLAGSLSLLWSNLNLNQEDGEAARPHSLLLNVYLEHSGTSLLNLTIVTQPSVPPSSKIGRALTSLVRLKHRWQSLVLTGQDDWTVWLDSTGESAIFPELQSLTLLTSRSANLTLFQQAPKLHHFVTTQRAAQDAFPWSQLDSLAVPLYPRALRSIVGVCKRPKSLTFWVVDKIGDHIETLPVPERIDTLEALEISFLGTDFASAREPFDNITAPSLQTMFVGGRTGRVEEATSGWPKHSLQGFLLRSSCPLTALSIQHVPLSDCDLYDLLSLLPSLAYLSVDDSGFPSQQSPITSRLVQSLHAFRPSALRSTSPVSISKALVPKLLELRLTVSGDNASGRFSDTDFVDMVSSRWLPYAAYAAQLEVSCLRSVVLRFPDRDVDEGVYRPLQLMERAGLRAVVIGASRRL